MLSLVEAAAWAETWVEGPVQFDAVLDSALLLFEAALEPMSSESLTRALLFERAAEDFPSLRFRLLLALFELVDRPVFTVVVDLEEISHREAMLDSAAILDPEACAAWAVLTEFEWMTATTAVPLAGFE